MTEDQILVVPHNTNESITQEFTCNATGAPNLHIYWRHKNSLIQTNTEKYSIETTNVTTNSLLITLHSVLTIKDPSLTDSGNVTCAAGIKYRKDSDFANVNNLIIITASEKRDLVVLGELKNVHSHFQYILHNTLHVILKFYRPCINPIHAIVFLCVVFPCICFKTFCCKI